MVEPLIFLLELQQKPAVRQRPNIHSVAFSTQACVSNLSISIMRVAKNIARGTTDPEY